MMVQIDPQKILEKLCEIERNELKQLEHLSKYELDQLKLYKLNETFKEAGEKYKQDRIKHEELKESFKKIPNYKIGTEAFLKKLDEFEEKWEELDIEFKDKSLDYPQNPPF